MGWPSRPTEGVLANFSPPEQPVSSNPIPIFSAHPTDNHDLAAVLCIAPRRVFVHVQTKKCCSGLGHSAVCSSVMRQSRKMAPAPPGRETAQDDCDAWSVLRWC